MSRRSYGDHDDAPASKPGCYGLRIRFVAARLAGGSDLKDADAGKPDCYGVRSRFLNESPTVSPAD